MRMPVEKAFAAIFALAVLGVVIGYLGWVIGSHSVWKIGVLLAVPLYLFVLTILASLAFVWWGTEQDDAASFGDSLKSILFASAAYFGSKLLALVMASAWIADIMGLLPPERSTAQQPPSLFQTTAVLARVGLIAALFFVCGLSWHQFRRDRCHGWNTVSKKITFCAVLLAGIALFTQLILTGL